MILCYLLYMKTVHDDGRGMRTVTLVYLWPPFYTSSNDSYRATDNILLSTAYILDLFVSVPAMCKKFLQFLI